MKKTIRLTEKDLTRIVKRIISEQGEDTQEKEDAAVKIMDMISNMQDEQYEIVRLLHTSGLMSHSKVKRIKNSFDQINDEIATIATKFRLSAFDI